MLDLFLRHGANPSQEDKDSVQPLVGAAASGQLRAVELLLKEGSERMPVDVNDEDNKGRTALHGKFLAAKLAGS